jgi:hypothetical protein
MSESFRDDISILALWVTIGGIVIGLAIAAWGFSKGIIAALFFIAAGIFWGYHIRIIRKKDDEIASLQRQIEQYENPEQKSSPDVCGTYEIVDAKNPQGIEYKGTLTIDEWSKWLSCKWENREWARDQKEIYGFGLRVGKALAFSYKYCDSKKVDHKGVMHYRIKIDHLRGRCVEFGEPPHAGFEECKKK